MTYDFRLGRWQDREAFDVDSIICDPPYSARTHAGHNAGSDESRQTIDYEPMTAESANAFVEHWHGRFKDWFCVMCDDALITVWRDAFESRGLISFQAIPLVMRGMSRRSWGEGPPSWAVWMVVARRREQRHMNAWWHLPGAYESTPPERGLARIGGKPLSLMSQIVRDYSREGDTVYDPFAGHATTGVAALQLGRHFVGDECDAAAHAAGLARLQRVVAQPSLFEAKTKTGELFSEAE